MFNVRVYMRHTGFPHILGIPCCVLCTLRYSDRREYELDNILLQIQMITISEHTVHVHHSGLSAKLDLVAEFYSSHR